MNIGFIASGIGCLLFLFLALVFTLLKDKGAMLISGFLFLIWAAIWGVGAILSYFFTQYMAVIAFVIWLIVFMKDVHSDNEKAFGKYKL